jgi:hypothetical protein
MQRRHFIRAFSAGALLTAASACTPLRVVFDAFEDGHHAGTPNARLMTASFLETILPFPDAGRSEMVEYFHAREYPIAAYLHVLLDELDSTSAKRTGRPWMQATRKQRLEIIHDIQRADGIARKVLDGAILVAQATYYGGAWDDAHGCPAIGYYGTRELEREHEISYKWSALVLRSTGYSSGNPS